MYSLTIFGNVDKCRTECEISDENANPVAVVYEAVDAWHVEIATPTELREHPALNATVDEAKQKLSHYVNRVGANPPKASTAAGLSLWLLRKDDGSALGIVHDELRPAVFLPLGGVTPDVENNVRLLARSGRRIEAIRELRKATNCSLEQANAWLDG